MWALILLLNINLDIELDRSLADDEEIDDEADPADLIQMTAILERVFYPEWKTMALCDYTDYAGYTSHRIYYRKFN